MSGFIDGMQAHMIAVLSSIADHIAAAALSQVGSVDLAMT